MAKTIRSHPTSPFILPEPFFGLFLYFQIWTQNGHMFSSFSNLPTCKKTGPQRKKDAHGPYLHIRFGKNVTFDMVFTIMFSFFREKTLS